MMQISRNSLKVDPLGLGGLGGLCASMAAPQRPVFFLKRLGENMECTENRLSKLKNQWNSETQNKLEQEHRMAGFGTLKYIYISLVELCIIIGSSHLHLWPSTFRSQMKEFLLGLAETRRRFPNEKTTSSEKEVEKWESRCTTVEFFLGMIDKVK